MRIQPFFYCLLPSVAALAETAAKPQYQRLPSLREQAILQDEWRTERLENIPTILRKYGVDAWLMSQREYGEDTAFWSIKKATQFSVRRRTVHVFFANAGEANQTQYQFVDLTTAVFEELKTLFEKHQPRSIALNVDPDIAFAGGLHVGLYNELVEQLGPKWSDKFIEAPMVAVEYIATMPSSQLSWYKRLQETAWAMIEEGLSERVITPGKTTKEDVEWWLRDKIQAMNYTTWFQPSVSILYTDKDFQPGPFPPPGRTIIKHHDILHVDFGVTALGLNTDTQHLAYVLGPGETENDIPQGVLDGLSKVNRLQDIVRKHLIVGKTGNEILHNVHVQMKKENIQGRIYCHPVGDWGHSAGTMIGSIAFPDPIPVLGDMPLLDRTYYSIELFAEHFLPERNRTINFYQEEDVHWVEKNRWDWVYDQQTELLVVKSEQNIPLGEDL